MRRGCRGAIPTARRHLPRPRSATQPPPRLGPAPSHDVFGEAVALRAQHEGALTGESASGSPPRVATRSRGWASSKAITGTRKWAPAAARNTLGLVGSAHPAERATKPPPEFRGARSVPTFPGSPTRQSASPIAPPGSRSRSPRRKTAMRARVVPERTERLGATRSLSNRSRSAGRSWSTRASTRLEAGVEGGRDEILPCADEEPEPRWRRDAQPAYEPDARIGRRGDH